MPNDPRLPRPARATARAGAGHTTPQYIMPSKALFDAAQTCVPYDKMADCARNAGRQRGVVDSPVGGGGVMIWKATALLLGVIWGLLALLTLLEIYEETKALTVAVMLLVGFLIAYGMFELDQ